MLVIIFAILALKAFVNEKAYVIWNYVILVYVQWDLGNEDNIIIKTGTIKLSKLALGLALP